MSSTVWDSFFWPFNQWLPLCWIWKSLNNISLKWNSNTNLFSSTLCMSARCPLLECLCKCSFSPGTSCLLSSVSGPGAIFRPYQWSNPQCLMSCIFRPMSSPGWQGLPIEALSSLFTDAFLRLPVGKEREKILTHKLNLPNFVAMEAQSFWQSFSFFNLHLIKAPELPKAVRHTTLSTSALSSHVCFDSYYVAIKLPEHSKSSASGDAGNSEVQRVFNIFSSLLRTKDATEIIKYGV